MFRRAVSTVLRTRSRSSCIVARNACQIPVLPVNNNKPFTRYQSTKPLEKQELMLAFTCNKCSTRSSHVISKQAYTGGTVLVQCPGCSNRHLIADHLKIFKDNKFTIEQLMEVSKSTNDLVFDEIPEKLKGVLGCYAKDAPDHMKDEEDDNGEIKKIK